jgi:hypothetical protein
MRLFCAALLLLMSTAPGVAFAAPQDERYRLVGEPDVASEFILHADGRFDYFLSAGALDEMAQGRWTREGNIIRLTTVPKPKPPEFTLQAVDKTGDAPLTVRVTWPDGRGIAGVDLMVTFDTGDPVTSYTQEYGWSLDAAEKRVPQSIILAVPMHGLQSQPFAIDAGKANSLSFILTPNDLGLVNFDDVSVTIEADRLVVHRGGGDLSYMLEQP